MCLIVDVNVAPRILLTNDDPDFKDVHASLFANRKPTAILIYGGKLVDEYRRNRKVERMLAVLDRNGRAKTVKDELLEKELKTVMQTELCKSNDEHIIALARAGNVRLLCSHDANLHADFTNKALLDTPRGKVYQNRSHRKLLDRFCKAGKPNPKTRGNTS